MNVPLCLGRFILFPKKKEKKNQTAQFYCCPYSKPPKGLDWSFYSSPLAVVWQLVDQAPFTLWPFCHLTYLVHNHPSAGLKLPLHLILKGCDETLLYLSKSQILHLLQESFQIHRYFLLYTPEVWNVSFRKQQTPETEPALFTLFLRRSCPNMVKLFFIPVLPEVWKLLTKRSAML